MNPTLNRRQITEFAIAAGVLSSSQSARAFAFSIFGAQVDTDKTSRRSDMPDPQTQYPPLPPDDLSRTLTSANPDHEGRLPHIGLVGDTYTITVDGDDTNGRFCVVDMHIPAGGGPGPHRHDFEETFIVLSGEIEATFRGKKSVVHAGETVNIPANVPHQFHNMSTNPARLICICSPAGQEKFFMEVGVPVATRTASPPKLDDNEMAAFLDKAKGLAPKYRTELLKKA
jgi:mannose-6-phosphate isomerase-like protein (cupin superfamily)